MAYKSTINTGLPNIPDPPDPAFFAEFARVYNAIRNLTLALDSYTGMLGPDPDKLASTPIASTLMEQNLLRICVKFYVNVGYGKFVNLFPQSGILQARYSSAFLVQSCMHGWCNTPGGVTAGNYGEVLLGGLCSSVGSLTPGSTYYTGNTDGTISLTPGTVSQKIGYALSTTQLYVRPDLV